MATCDVTKADLEAMAAAFTAAATKATTAATTANSAAATLEAQFAVTTICRQRLIDAALPAYDAPIAYLTQQIDSKKGQALDLRNSAANYTAQAAIATASATNFTAAATALNPATPTVTSVSPNRGLPAGGQTVVVTGTGFTDAIGITFGGVDATGVVINSNTQITCVTPAHAIGAVDVIVFVTGSSGTLTNGYSYVNITTVAPSTGAPAGGTAVTLTGFGFTGATKVQFGGVDATDFVVVSNTSITCTTPAGTGTVNVIVFHPDGDIAKLNGFVYA